MGHTETAVLNFEIILTRRVPFEKMDRLRADLIWVRSVVGGENDDAAVTLVNPG